MFICTPCRRKHYENEPSWHYSYGLCELCESESKCSDIPSNKLRPRMTQPIPGETDDTVLGALVRQMKPGWVLEREGWTEHAWNVHGENHNETTLHDTPEAALREALTWG